MVSLAGTIQRWRQSQVFCVSTRPKGGGQRTLVAPRAHISFWVPGQCVWRNGLRQPLASAGARPVISNIVLVASIGVGLQQPHLSSHSRRKHHLAAAVARGIGVTRSVGGGVADSA